MLSNDEIRRKLIDDYFIMHPDSDAEEAFYKTSPQVSVELENKLNEIIEHNDDNTIVYIDKNHPPAVLNHFKDQLKNCDTIGLIPDILNPHKIGKDRNYPLSLQFLLTCYMRVLNRK